MLDNMIGYVKDNIKISKNYIKLKNSKVLNK